MWYTEACSGPRKLLRTEKKRGGKGADMLDRNTPKSLSSQLKEILLEKINSGEWKPEEKIPSENELSTQYGLSRMTTRAVLTELVREGLLFRVQGKGTYVSNRVLTLSPGYTGIRKQLEEIGYQVTTKVLEADVVKCDRMIASKLGVRTGTAVFRIRRLRLVENKPISLHVSYISRQYSKKLKADVLEEEQLCVVLNREYGLARKKMVETLESTVAREEETILGVKPGDPLLLLEDIIFDEKDKPYEFTKVVFRGDKVKIRLLYES